MLLCSFQWFPQADFISHAHIISQAHTRARLTRLLFVYDFSMTSQADMTSQAGKTAQANTQAMITSSFASP